MSDDKEKDVQSMGDEEEVITEETATEDTGSEDATTEEMTEEAVIEEVIVEEVIVEEITEADPEAAAPMKKGRTRGFFKTRKLAIGITVLVVLLVANVAVLGMNKMSHKGGRDHGGRTTVEREYTQGQMHDSGKHIERGDKDTCKTDMSEKGDKADRGDKGEKADKADKSDMTSAPAAEEAEADSEAA